MNTQEWGDVLKIGVILAVANKIKNLENQILGLKNIIYQKDSTIFRLTEENRMLKESLEQKKNYK